MSLCKRCSCWENEYNINCTPLSGNGDAELYFLGEMAGDNEARKLLDGILEVVGLNERDIAVSNSLRCYKANNTKPTIRELDSCFIFTMREINKVKPKLVIALGEIALYQTTGKKGIENYRGKLLWSDKLNCKVFISFRPTIIRKDKIIEDFKRIKSLVGEEPEEQKHYHYTSIDTVEKFDAEYNEILGYDMYFDLETEGLDEYDRNLNIKTLQVGNGYDVFVITRDVLYARVNKIKEWFNKNPVIGQDFSFDAKWLFVKLGIFPKMWKHDCCLAEYLLTGMKHNDLVYTTGKYNKEYYGYWEEVKNQGGAHKVKDTKVLHQYGADDVGTMVPIAKSQYKMLYKNNMEWLFNNITMPSNKVLTKMSLRGVTIDLDMLWKLDTKYKKKAEKTLMVAKSVDGITECEHHFGRNFNPKSALMLKWLLLDYYKLPILSTTKKGKGNPSISQKEMKLYAKKHKNRYCQLMNNYRSIETIRVNFLSGMVPKLKNGLAHTKYSLHSTATGRPNSKEPNLLNFPVKKEYKDIKKIIKPRKGFKFVTADLAQIEVRVAAVIYDDQNLIDVCNEEGRDDFHSVITAKVYGLTYEEISSKYQAGDVEMTDKRRKCKSVTFGVLYQQTAWALAYLLGVTEREAQKFIDEYFDMFPSLKYNIEKTKQFVIKHGYVDSYFNFRRYFKNHSEEDYGTIREAVNHRIQSTAFQILQLQLIEIDNILEKGELESALLMQIYDQVIIETKEEEIDIVVPMVKRVMETIHKPYHNLNRVNLKADIEIGDNNLGELRKAA